MSAGTRQPKVMTMAEMEADAAAATFEAAAKKAPDDAKVIEVVKTTTPEPLNEEPPAPPQPEPVEELETLKATLSEREARITEQESRINELTKRVRDEDGKRGGELTALRDQVGRLGNQLQELMAENRELRQKPAVPPTPPEPDSLATDYPDVAKAVDRRTDPIREEAKKAKVTAEESKQEILRLREERYFDTIKQAVPTLDQYIGSKDPDFAKWCDTIPPGDDETRQTKLIRFQQTYNAAKTIELLKQWEALKTTAASKPDASTGVIKPTREGQVAIPAAGSTPPPPATKRRGVDLNRIQALKDKIMRFGTATKDDRLEYERLIDQQALEEGTG